MTSYEEASRFPWVVALAGNRGEGCCRNRCHLNSHRSLSISTDSPLSPAMTPSPVLFRHPPGVSQPQIPPELPTPTSGILIRTAPPDTPLPSAPPRSARVRLPLGQEQPASAYPSTNGNAGGKLPRGTPRLGPRPGASRRRRCRIGIGSTLLDVEEFGE